MSLDTVLLVVGILIAWLTLRDVFDTVVVPGGSRASLRVTRRVGYVFLFLWKHLRRRPGISGSFAPLVLVSSFVIWMSLLALAFGIMVYAVRAHFVPPVETFGDAVYEAGSAIVTVGLSPHTPAGAGRWVILGAGFCGLAVITMAVTYLLEVQSSVTRRDTGIIKLNTSAGNPPSALALMERFAAIRHQSHIADILEEGRNWCATVRQSHLSHPSLIYFQSVSTGAGWPAALGALLDLALFAEHLVDDDRLYGPAVLLRDEGSLMAKELSLITRVKRLAEVTDQNILRNVAARLEACGYRLHDNPDFGEMARQRSEYSGCTDALADYLGKPGSPLLGRQPAAP
jgi:hypothetical protein